MFIFSFSQSGALTRLSRRRAAVRSGDPATRPLMISTARTGALEGGAGSCELTRVACRLPSRPRRVIRDARLPSWMTGLGDLSCAREKAGEEYVTVSGA